MIGLGWVVGGEVPPRTARPIGALGPDRGRAAGLNSPRARAPVVALAPPGRSFGCRKYLAPNLGRLASEEVDR